MTRNAFTRWRTDFLAGLAVVLPVILSVAVLYWLFGTVANFTDTLLVFLPRSVTHQAGGQGPAHWYWSVVAFLLALLSVSLIGRVARHFIGKKLIEAFDFVLLRVPLLNKIYGTLKQVNDAFGSGGKSSFKQVVLVEFPRSGQYSVGFITSDEHPAIQERVGRKLVSVFVPTTPNPTAGFLILVPMDSLTPLDMNVAEGIKFIISLGSISPDGTAVPLPPR